ncbi:MAG: hypothetical protein IKK41_01905 [Oscillospiraceae bacterium]|nr:hypothetical protein [Oscillospiraceae bacterium]
MKKSIKRLSALLLTLCMLASLMVPVAFADDVEPVAPAAEKAETYPIRLVDLTQTDSASASGWNTSFVGGSGYKSITIYDGDAVAGSIVNTITKSYDNGELNWKPYAASGEYIFRTDRMFMARLGLNKWAALQIKVSDAGIYALNLTTDKNADDDDATAWSNKSTEWAGAVTAYIVPLDVVAAAANGVADVMTEQYNVGTVDMAADQTDITFAKTRMEAGEYVVVYTSTTDAYSISEMSLLETAEDAAKYELQEVVNYPIRLADPTSIPTTEPGTWFLKSGAYTSTYMSSVADEILAAYGAGDLNWKFVASNTTSDGDLRYRTDVNMMLRTKKNELTALQIKVPNSGNYSLKISQDRTAAYDTGLTYVLTEYPTYTAYMVNVKDLEADVTAENIAALAVEANSVGSVELAEGVTSGLFNRTFLEAGEYVLIFTHNKSNAAVASFGLMQRAYEVIPEDNETEVVEDVTYNFDLFNTERYAPIFTDGTSDPVVKKFTNQAAAGLDGVYNAGDQVGVILENDYNNGIINWKLVDPGNLSGLVFEVNGEGLRMRNDKSADAQYAAFCINVPATSLYSVNLRSEFTANAALNVYLYDADATNGVADYKENGKLLASFAAKADTIFSSVLTAGENILVFEIPGTGERINFKLSAIELEVNNDPTSYSFDLSTNDAYKAAIVEKANGAEIAFTWGSGANMYKITYTDDDGVSQSINPYAVLGTMFTSGQIDWALDYIVTSSSPATKGFSPYEGSLRLRMKTDGTGYAGIRLRIKNAGLYNVTVNATTEGDPITAYLFPAETAYTKFSDCVDLSSYLIDSNKLGVAADKNSPITASFNAAETGEYILVLKGNSDAVKLSSLELEPVQAAAYADGVACGSFEEAIAKATESVVLCENVVVNNLDIPAGVSLDLNGYNLYSTSVYAAPGAHIVDSTDGDAMIRGDITFYEKNEQLPLYDMGADGYHLYSVDVVPVATTGTGNMTKYWFQVKFTNKDALNLIGATTELRIKALLSGNAETETAEPISGEAVADAAFSANWAAKYAANDGIYITVATVGSGDYDNFVLNPAVFANNVTISGDDMYKNSYN